MNLDHLDFPNYGWGFMPPTEKVFAAFKYCQEMYNPTHVFEIGFHLGHSTTYQLEIYKNAKILSISPENDSDHLREEIRKKDDVIPAICRKWAAQRLNKKYGKRWIWVPGYNRDKNVWTRVSRETFDFALVDGHHTYDDALFDLKYCKELGIKNLLIDNLELTTVKTAVEKSEYQLIKSFPYVSNFKQKQNQCVLGVLKYGK